MQPTLIMYDSGHSPRVSASKLAPGLGAVIYKILEFVLPPAMLLQPSSHSTSNGKVKISGSQLDDIR
jgi:hypothetical protein